VYVYHSIGERPLKEIPSLRIQDWDQVRETMKLREWMLCICSLPSLILNHLHAEMTSFILYQTDSPPQSSIVVFNIKTNRDTFTAGKEVISCCIGVCLLIPHVPSADINMEELEITSDGMYCIIITDRPSTTFSHSSGVNYSSEKGKPRQLKLLRFRPCKV
jgi:hypothetical protein